MITVLIREVATRRGIENAHQLHKATNFAPAVAANLWKGELEKIGINTLDTLCRVLRCKPNDLLKYDPDE